MLKLELQHYCVVPRKELYVFVHFVKKGREIEKRRDMGRAPCCDKANVKKGPWSPEEDSQLKHYIETYGTGGNWISLPQKAGLRRCGKSCRLRWLNYLRPNIKHGEFSAEEDRIICTLFATIGSRWSIIAAQLPGRTDNDIKNYWNTKLKKKLMGMMVSSSTTSKSPQAVEITKKTESLSPILLCHQNPSYDHQPLSNNYNSLNQIIAHPYEEKQPLSSSTNSIIPFNACCNNQAIITSSGSLVTNPFDHQYWQCYETLKTNPVQMGLFEFGSGSFNLINSNYNNNYNNEHGGNFGENAMDYEDGMLLNKNMEDLEEQIKKKKKKRSEMEEKNKYCYYY